jgi:hypothetical protein
VPHGYPIETKEVFTNKPDRKPGFPLQAVPFFDSQHEIKTKHKKQRIKINHLRVTAG